MTTRALVLAFYAEGETDERFLPTVIRRTAEDVLVRYGRTSVDVLDPVVIDGRDIKRRFARQDERILQAARAANGYHALLVHADADYPTRVRAFNERFQPGWRLVQQPPTHDRCTRLMPIIPIHMVEAWMLADADALREIIGTTVNAQRLGLPPTIRQIERCADPNSLSGKSLERLMQPLSACLGTFRIGCKALLQQVIQNASAAQTRRRHAKVSEIPGPLAQKVRLDQLVALNAYRQFRRDLLIILAQEHLVEPRVLVELKILSAREATQMFNVI